MARDAECAVFQGSEMNPETCTYDSCPFGREAGHKVSDHPKGWSAATVAISQAEWDVCEAAIARRQLQRTELFSMEAVELCSKEDGTVDRLILLRQESEKRK